MSARLEEIKESTLTGFDMFGEHCVTITKENYVWLIKQAERVEELELELEKSTNKDFEAHLLKQVESAKVQNERYKQALELIYKDTFYESEYDLVSPIHVIRKRAEKALEGDDD